MAKKSKATEVEVFEDIRKSLHLHSSFRFIFLQGMVKGLGTVFGATVLVAAVTSIAIQFADVALIGDILKALVGSSIK